jgi:hypothetical protein
LGGRCTHLLVPRFHQNQTKATQGRQHQHYPSCMFHSKEQIAAF